MKVFTPKGLTNKIKLWSLRAIFDCDGVYNLVMCEDIICDFFGIERDLEKTKIPEVTNVLKKELIRLESLKSAGKIGSNANLRANLELVKNTLNLNETERDLLEFLVICKSVGVIKELMGRIRVDPFELNFFISKLIDVKVSLVKPALSPNSALISCKIIKLDKDRYNPDFNDFIDFCDDDLPFNLVELKNPSIDELFSGILRKCSGAKLGKKDFEHLPFKPDVLLKYLENSKNKGVNILLYGEVGTGKTEFCKMIANALNKELYEVSYLDDRGNSASGYERFSKLICANAVLNGNSSFIMFDEVEDVFKDSDISKALINRTLEENSVPSFWLTNDVYSMDNAYIRRFDVVIHFENPPKYKRKELLESYASGILSEKAINKISKNKELAPALIESASKVTKALGGDKKLFKNLVESNLKAQGKLRLEVKKSKKDKGVALPESYDTSYINTNADLQGIVEGVKRSGNARICLYGVAGTGKSAYAKYLARELGREIIIKKASELLGMYVGESEKNIARAFKEAKDKKAVLCFDEVDSFLQDRNTAVRSWEVSMVNEMLVQMESFDGVFIATTNLCDSLDKASLRRFDMKIEFGYLKAEQARKLFEKECEILGLEVSKSALNLVGSLKALTPGDFAAVKRANAFCPISNSDDFANRLKDEVKLKKTENSRKIGF